MSGRLVIQSPDLCFQAIQTLADLVQATKIDYLGPTAARLINGKMDTETRLRVQNHCQSYSIDFAFLPKPLSLSDYKVLALDMDSTLINIECIDELADLAGVKSQVAAITEATMRGDIPDFNKSLRQRVALLAGLPINALEEVYRQRLRLNPGAETLITAVQKAGLKVLLVSGGFTFFTDRLCQQLQLDKAYANVLSIQYDQLDGTLKGEIVDAEAKAALLIDFAKRYQANKEQIIAMGDGANDLKMLSQAGLPVAYHAKPIVQQYTSFALNVSGLDGVLRWFN